MIIIGRIKLGLQIMVLCGITAWIICRCSQPANDNVKSLCAQDHILVLSHVCTRSEDSTLACQTSLADLFFFFFFFLIVSVPSSRGSRKNSDIRKNHKKHPGLHSHVLEDSASPPLGRRHPLPACSSPLPTLPTTHVVRSRWQCWSSARVKRQGSQFNG